MNIPSNVSPTRPTNSVWVKIGAIFFLAVLGFLFFFMAASRQRHRPYDEVPTGGSAPGKPGEVIAH
jgi:hypothetical protein